MLQSNINVESPSKAKYASQINSRMSACTLITRTPEISQRKAKVNVKCPQIKLNSSLSHTVTKAGQDLPKPDQLANKTQQA